ncbi:MAG: protein kinase [Galbitalea sp.]
MTSEVRPEDLLSGRYLLGELLGSGGTASVFRATDTLTGKTVAVKVLHPHLSRSVEAREAFFDEAMAVAALDHPNIVRVHTVGVHDAGGVEIAWLAEDLAPGLSVADYLEANGAAMVAQALTITRGVLEALVAAHGEGIVHRDIGPTNIIVDPDSDGVVAAHGVRLVDFGLADIAGRTTLAADGSRTTEPAGVLGNANYLSPEQARGEPVSESADLYQTGAVLYTLLTGAVPYPRSIVDDVIRAHASSPPPVPSATRGSVPREVDRIVVRAMATAPAMRFASAEEMLDAVVAATRAVVQDAPAAVTMVLRPAPPARAGGRETAGGGRVPRPRRAAAPLPALGGVAATVVVLALLVWGVVSYQLAVQQGSGRSGPAVRPSASATASPNPAGHGKAGAAGSTLVTVPDLTTVPASAAAGLLVASGLVFGSLIATDADAAEGTVIGTSPAIGAAVGRGTTVDVLIASGNNTVPPVAGLGYDAAVAAMQAAGFAVAAQSIPSGSTITGTSPSAGASAGLGSVLEFTYLTPSGPTPTATPAP